MYEYILALTASGGCCFGFILGGYCFSDKTRIESLDNDIDEIEDQLNTSQQYCRYLENMLNNSTAVTTESSVLNVVDASANVTQMAMIDRIINTPPPSPEPRVRLSRNRNRRNGSNQPTAPPPSPQMRIREFLSNYSPVSLPSPSAPTAPPMPHATLVDDQISE